MPLNLPAQPHIIIPDQMPVARDNSSSFLNQNQSSAEDPEITKNRQLNNVLLQDQVDSLSQNKADAKLLQELRIEAGAVRTALAMKAAGEDPENIQKEYEAQGGKANLNFTQKGKTQTFDIISPKTQGGFKFEGDADKFKIVENVMQAVQRDPQTFFNPDMQKILREQGISWSIIKPSDTPDQEEERRKRLITEQEASERRLIDIRSKNESASGGQAYENPTTGERILVPKGGVPPKDFYPIGSAIVSQGATGKLPAASVFGPDTHELTPEDQSKVNTQALSLAQISLANNMAYMQASDAEKTQMLAQEKAQATTQILGPVIDKYYDASTGTISIRFQSNNVIRRPATPKEAAEAHDKYAASQQQGSQSQPEQPQQQSFLQPGTQSQPVAPQGNNQSVLSPDAEEPAQMPRKPITVDSQQGKQSTPVVNNPSKASPSPTRRNYTIGEIPDAIVTAFKNRPTASENINSFTKAMGEKGIGFSAEDVKTLGKWLIGKTDAQKDAAIKAAIKAKSESEKAWQHFLSIEIPISKD